MKKEVTNYEKYDSEALQTDGRIDRDVKKVLDKLADLKKDNDTLTDTYRRNIRVVQRDSVTQNGMTKKEAISINIYDSKSNGWYDWKSLLEQYTKDMNNDMPKRNFLVSKLDATSKRLIINAKT